VRLRDRLQDAGGLPDRGGVDLLQPQLQAGDVTAGERLLQLRRELVGVDCRRGDQVKPGGRRRFVIANDQSSADRF
jgi:hypothetical protein